MTLIEKYSHKERRLAQKTQAVIVFLKLDFDLTHIIFKKFGREFDEKSFTNDVFLKRNHNFSYVICDTNEREVKKWKGIWN